MQKGHGLMHIFDISPSTVELVIGSMVKSGVLRKLGQGRGVKYLR